MNRLTDTDHILLDLLQRGLPDAGWGALNRVRGEASAGADLRIIGRRFAALGRQVGRGLLPAETPPIAGATDPVEIAGWSLATAARASLLLALAHGMEAAVAIYDKGEIDERIACLRALPLLEATDGGVIAVEDGCRSNVIPLFDAATVNPYASRWLDDDAFAHAILKRATLGLPLSPVIRLYERGGAEVARMLRGLVRERKISGRPWPPEAAEVAARLEAKG